MEKEEKMKKRKDKKKEKEAAKKGAVTNSWGKYGIIKEVDMWLVLSALPSFYPINISLEAATPVIFATFLPT